MQIQIQQFDIDSVIPEDEEEDGSS